MRDTRRSKSLPQLFSCFQVPKMPLPYMGVLRPLKETPSFCSESHVRGVRILQKARSDGKPLRHSYLDKTTQTVSWVGERATIDGHISLSSECSCDTFVGARAKVGLAGSVPGCSEWLSMSELSFRAWTTLPPHVRERPPGISLS